MGVIEMPALFEVLMFLGALAAFMYLLAPIVIKSSQFLQATLQFEPLFADQLPPFARDFIQRCVHGFTPLGFVAVESFRTINVAPDILAFVLILVDSERRDICQLISTMSLKMSIVRSVTITMKTEYEDGGAIVTTTAKTGVFPRNPRNDTLVLPGRNDPTLLARVHRLRCERSNRMSQKRPVPVPGTWLDYIREEYARDVQRVTDAGYYWLDVRAQVYRPTWKGAYLMSWKLLWPVKQLRRLGKQWRANSVLRSLRATASL
jgi:hypothetical protein